MANQDAELIANQYRVDASRTLSPVGGLAAFGVIDEAGGRSDLMAIELNRHIPARPLAFQALATPIEGLLTPVALGPVGNTGYAVCLAPPGPAVGSRTRPWSEMELLQCVLRPGARVLEQMQQRGLAHRGIRLDNVFQAAPGQPIVLGSAWTAPPAMAQPALFEPPYAAMCLASGRGEGHIADDVYALGVLLACLALGHASLAGQDEAAILRRKLELGTFAAVVGEERLPPMIGDLVRGMLAEDPEHRPPPALLLDPASARGRRVAARSPRRAKRPMMMPSGEIWNARSLAHALATQPDHAAHALRGGAVETWLRRELGDGQLAARVEEVARNCDPITDAGYSEAALTMRVIALLDPLAPLCWRGIAVWPDGIATALAFSHGRDETTSSRLEEIIVGEEVANWAGVRPERCDYLALRAEARLQHSWLRQQGEPSETARLVYLTNPLLPCDSPLVDRHWVARLPDLLPALEEAASRVDRAKMAPIDPALAAFIAARLERRIDHDLSSRTNSAGEAAVCLAQVRVLAQLQARQQARPLPALAAWLAARAGPLLVTWRNRQQRVALEQRLRSLTEAGYLPPMLQALEDPAGRSADALGANRAAQELEQINVELARIAEGAAARAAIAARLGLEVAAGFGLAALAAALVAAALG